MGLTQQQLAVQVGIRFQQIQKYERGSNRMGSSRLFEFTKVLDVPVSYFFDEMPANALAGRPMSGRGRKGFGETGTPFPPDCVPSRTITVVDTTPQPRPGGEVTRRLLREIDCTATEPDYVGGGATRVVRKSFGAYRESGATGWYGHMNSTEPSWFAYTVRVPSSPAVNSHRRAVTYASHPDPANAASLLTIISFIPDPVSIPASVRSTYRLLV